MRDIVGCVHSTETFGALDGPGIRYILFLQGCSMRCKYCHNPDTWKLDGGKEMSAREVIDDVLKYKSFLSGGITLSGGEPLLQTEFCEEIMRLAHKHHLHCAIDTSGSVPLEMCKSAVEAADLILLDIKTADSWLHEELTGMPSRNTLEMLNFCEKIEKDVWIRHVLVPGITMKENLMKELSAFLKSYSCIKRLDLLPFHKLGEFKWKAVDAEYTLADTPVPTNAEMEHAKEIFKKAGLPV